MALACSRIWTKRLFTASVAYCNKGLVLFREIVYDLNEERLAIEGRATIIRSLSKHSQQRRSYFNATSAVAYEVLISAYCSQCKNHDKELTAFECYAMFFGRVCANAFSSHTSNKDVVSL